MPARLQRQPCRPAARPCLPPACRFGRATYDATGVNIQGPPECCSYTFNEQGQVTSFTGGYVVDNRVRWGGVVGGVGCGGGCGHDLCCRNWNFCSAAASVPCRGAQHHWRRLLLRRSPLQVGNTDGLGAAFGILAAVGIKVPKPGSLQWEVATTVNRVLTALDKISSRA